SPGAPHRSPLPPEPFDRANRSGVGEGEGMAVPQTASACRRIPRGFSTAGRETAAAAGTGCRYPGPSRSLAAGPATDPEGELILGGKRVGAWTSRKSTRADTSLDEPQVERALLTSAGGSGDESPGRSTDPVS